MPHSMTTTTTRAISPISGYVNQGQGDPGWQEVLRAMGGDSKVVSKPSEDEATTRLFWQSLDLITRPLDPLKSPEVRQAEHNKLMSNLITTSTPAVLEHVVQDMVLRTRFESTAVQALESTFEWIRHDSDKNRATVIRFGLVGWISRLLQVLTIKDSPCLRVIFDDLMMAIFEMVFEPKGPEMEMAALNNALVTITPYVQAGFSLPPIVVKANEAYGVNVIVPRCLELLNNEKYRQLWGMDGLYDLVLMFLSHNVDDMHLAFGKADLSISLCRAYWRVQKSMEPAGHAGASTLPCIFGSLNTLYVTPKHRTIAAAVVQRLICDYDIILLMGRILIHGVSLRDEGELLQATESLGHLMSVVFKPTRPAVPADHVEPPWLHVWDSMKTITRCASSATRSSYMITALDIWRKIGARFGLKPPGALGTGRLPDATPSKQGCGWARCPVYRLDPMAVALPQMLQCYQCHRVQYCSIACQTRDWKDGEHANLCQSPHKPARTIFRPIARRK